MLIIGCDYHPSMQQIALVNTETGECGERRLRHRAEAEEFYRELKEKQVRVGIEATGHSRWFERMLAELKFELWIGDSAEIRAIVRDPGRLSRVEMNALRAPLTASQDLTETCANFLLDGPMTS